MIVSTLTIDINKEVPGIYTAQAMHGGVLVTEPVSYERIETAIREQARNIPDDFAHFVEFRYHGMSTGNLGKAEAVERARQLADRLIALVAEEHSVMVQ